MPPIPAQVIVEKIASQAAQEGVPLSEVERKMLLFSETSPTLPDMAQVNELFDREYDRQGYEKKIVRLIRHLRSTERDDPEADRNWTEAIKSLGGDDYYFMVMVNEACGRKRPRGDLIRLVVTAVVIVGVFLVVAYFLRDR